MKQLIYILLVLVLLSLTVGKQILLYVQDHEPVLFHPKHCESVILIFNGMDLYSYCIMIHFIIETDSIIDKMDHRDTRTSEVELMLQQELMVISIVFCLVVMDLQ